MVCQGNGKCKVTSGWHRWMRATFINVWILTRHRNLRQKKLQYPPKWKYFHFSVSCCQRCNLLCWAIKRYCNNSVFLSTVYLNLQGCRGAGVQGCRGGAVVRALASRKCVPGSNPGPGLSLLLVLTLAPRVFLRVLRVLWFSSLFKNQHF